MGWMQNEERVLKRRIQIDLGAHLGRKLPYLPQFLLRLGPPAEFGSAASLCLCWSWQRAPHAVSAWLPRELVRLGLWVLVLPGLGRVLTTVYLGNGNQRG